MLAGASGRAALPAESQTLLAVDLGLRTGLALYGRDGRLRWYRSTHFGRTEQLRRGAPRLLAELANPAYLVLEGGGGLADIWEHAAQRQGLALLRIDADMWRRLLLLPRERYDRTRLKAAADRLARTVIDWSQAPRPTALRHDAAEAILIGLWGVLQVGWLAEPPALRRRG